MSTKKEFAFPQGLQIDNIAKTEGGLTKREYFAMKLYARIFSGCDSESMVKYQASNAVKAADILLEELNKEVSNGTL